MIPDRDCVPDVVYPPVSLSSRPTLGYSRDESLHAHRTWKASCGPHALAAAANMSLRELRPHFGRFPGWTDQRMLESALIELGIAYRVTRGLKTRELCEGACTIQWVGPWLAPGREREAANQTHLIAYRQGWVLCTAVEPFQWVPAWWWAARLHGRPWFALEHYEFEPFRPTPLNTSRAHASSSEPEQLTLGV